MQTSFFCVSPFSPQQPFGFLSPSQYIFHPAFAARVKQITCEPILAVLHFEFFYFYFEKDTGQVQDPKLYAKSVGKHYFLINLILNKVVIITISVIE